MYIMRSGSVMPRKGRFGRTLASCIHVGGSMMPNDREHRQTLVPQEFVAQHPFPDAPPDAMLSGLTEAERRFILAYVKYGDTRKAFTEAGLEHGQKYPNQLAYNYLQRPKIKAAVARVQAFYAEQMGLSAWQILGSLHAHALHDPACIYEQDGD